MSHSGRKPEDTTCWYYANAVCMRGNTCHYLHDLFPPSAAPAQPIGLSRTGTLPAPTLGWYKRYRTTAQALELIIIVHIVVQSLA